MIQINELRIGNIVDQGVVIRIDEFCSVFKDGSSDYLNDLELEPIPLTESILLQCGLNKAHTTNNFTFDANGFTYGIDIKGNVDFNYNEYEKIITIKHLHELQNLYYVLTKTELPIDINTLKI